MSKYLSQPSYIVVQNRKKALFEQSISQRERGSFASYNPMHFEYILKLLFCGVYPIYVYRERSPSPVRGALHAKPAAPPTIGTLLGTRDSGYRKYCKIPRLGMQLRLDGTPGWVRRGCICQVADTKVGILCMYMQLGSVVLYKRTNACYSTGSNNARGLGIPYLRKLRHHSRTPLFQPFSASSRPRTSFTSYPHPHLTSYSV